MHDLLIIGGGVAGLSAGITAQKAGLSSCIVEQHFLPGGLCTAWERGGFVFDGCLSYLYGTAEGEPFSALWKELGLDLHDCVHLDEYIRIIDEQTDSQLVCYADPQRLQQELLAHCKPGSADARRVQALIRGIESLSGFDLAALERKPRSQLNLLEWLKLGAELMPFAGPALQWSFVSAGEYAQGFESPVLKRCFPMLFGWPEIPMIAGLAMVAALHKRNAGFPRGGSLAFARKMEQRYLELGGSILYEKRVDHIVCERVARGASSTHHARGVVLFSDEILEAKAILSCADGRTTIFEMLGPEFIEKRHRKIYTEDYLPTHSQVQLSLGLNSRSFDFSPWTLRLCAKPWRFLNQQQHQLSFRCFDFDSSLAPPEKRVLELMLRIPYRYFQRIYGHKLYAMEEAQVADQALDELDRAYPGIKAQVEKKDVATPLTYERYTGNWKGSSCGWLLTPQTLKLLLLGMSKRIRGLKGFRMAGHWLAPGGSVPLSAQSGRNAVLELLKELPKLHNT